MCPWLAEAAFSASLRALKIWHPRTVSLIKEALGQQNTLLKLTESVGNRVSGVDHEGLGEAHAHAHDQAKHSRTADLVVPLGTVLFLHVTDGDGQQESTQSSSQVPKDVHVRRHGRHCGHRDHHENDPDHRSLACWPQDLPGEKDLGEPDTDQPEPGGGGSDRELVGVHCHGHKVAEKATREINHHHLLSPKLPLHAEAHSELEEHIEEEMGQVRMEHDGSHQSPDLPASQGGAPGRTELVQDAGRRICSVVAEPHGEDKLRHD
eukprot:s3382_g13.t1